MPPEHRFILADFTVPGPSGRPRLYEAGKHYPIPPAVAHAAAKRELVAKGKPARWVPPRILTPPERRLSQFPSEPARNRGYPGGPPAAPTGVATEQVGWPGQRSALASQAC